MERAAFLDRDGVIIRKLPEGQYLTRLEEMQFLPGAADAIGLLNRSGFRVIVVSNQRCVAKGLITEGELLLIHQRMCNELAGAGAKIDGIYYCPHEKIPPCNCRKPAPGMLLRAADEHHIDLTRSWMIGDSESDMEAGRNAGCKTALVVDPSATMIARSDLSAHSLLDVIHLILAESPTNSA